MTKTSLAMTFVAVATLGLCAAFLLRAFGSLPAADLGAHGWAALIVGTGASFLVGGILSAILVISRRRGYDEAAHELCRAKPSED